MVIKYYGTSFKAFDLNARKELLVADIIDLYLVDAYRNDPNSPSYCVWLVPGTFDTEGNDIIACE